MALAIKPMLAEPIDIDDLGIYLLDDGWWTQRKADGHRLLVEVTDGQIKVWNRQGMTKSSGVTHAILAQFEEFDAGHWVFDGELVDGRLLLFDLPQAGSIVTPITHFEDRYLTLSTLMEQWHPDPAHVQLLSCGRTTEEKVTMFETAQNEHGEGLILRLRSGVYQTGRRPQLRKAKFTKDGDFIVINTKQDGHNNVVLALLDPANDRVVEVGRASANGKRPVPAIGDVWSATYLYVVDRAAPRLVQPRITLRRSHLEYSIYDVADKLVKGPLHSREEAEAEFATGRYPDCHVAAVAVGDKLMHECLIDQLDHAYTDKNIRETKTRSDM